MVDKITSPVGANDVIKKINDAIDAIPTSTTQLTNDSGYITGITSSMVTTALGYTPYNSTNPNGYITGITSSMVTTALGYTPESTSNKVTSISASSTNTQYPSAKCVYDAIQEGGGGIEYAMVITDYTT